MTINRRISPLKKTKDSTVDKHDKPYLKERVF